MREGRLGRCAFGGSGEGRRVRDQPALEQYTEAWKQKRAEQDGPHPRAV
jgi:hypothetical protein